VLSATNQVVSGRTVTFSTGADTTAFINNISASGVSDANGTVTAKLNLGGNKADRTITLTASADAATTTNSVDVTGTAITISGNSSLAFNAATTLTFSVKDSAGNALPNVTVSVASQTGNGIVLTPAAGVTNSSGQITATITATQAGNDVITATAAGASATQTLTINSASFAFTAPTLVPPATSIDIPLNTPTAVSVNWKNAGVPVPVGSTVNFATSRGTVAGSPTTTNATGDTPGVTVSSSSAGPAIITASGLGGTPAATLNVVFVATSASNATVQAIPGTIQVTTGSASQSNNSSTILVVVRDAANNLVKNAGLSFTITNDPSGGSLTSSSGITDVSGSASVTYIAGATSSAQNGVTIRATVNTVNGVAIAPISGSTNLTVSGQSLLVRLGTDNLIASAPPVNVKTYVAIVTDAAGNPVVGTTVQFALRPNIYRKGNYIQGATWILTPTIACPSLDTNFNGILDANEIPPGFDFGGQTPHLIPGAVASVNSSGTTNAGGIATATVTYPKDQAGWVQVTLEARTSVTSNDPPTLATFFLPVLATDVDDLSVNPPGNPSPYGSDGSCFDLN
jgi:hypothetical protein